MIPYAELQTTSNFSFLRGASHPEELVQRAAELGLAAIAITDRNSLAGVVRAHVVAREIGMRLIVGARLDFTDAPSLLCLPTDRPAYGRLSKLITIGRRRAPKGECHLTFAEFLAHQEGQIALALPAEGRRPEDDFVRHLRILAEALPGRCYLAASNHLSGGDRRRIAHLARLATQAGTPLAATNDVHFHVPERRPVQDAFTAIRTHCTVERAGYRLFANAERYLKDPSAMARLFAPWPEAVARTVEIAERCRFSLSELKYDYPDEAPPGTTAQEELVRLSWAGARDRYGASVPPEVARQLDHELALIGEKSYASYFLTVHDIVRFARRKGILCQGRGSAANSAVCYCLGITSVDPVKENLLFARFISTARDEPPDIDVDFEHERREEVIQYIYKKYTRDRAGLAATVIHYRSRSALREMAKAMGLTRDAEDALAAAIAGRHSRDVKNDHIREAGLDPDEPRLARTLRLARAITGFPRHLSQHVGGFVITRGPLDELVPIANAAMADRTTVEWDKDDLDALDILKVDVLALGMLTCIRKAFALIHDHYGKRYNIASVPKEDPGVYEMLCQADSIGVFQVESRAQMSMLPRLKPREFYDLVIEVAIVRPGPIQGDMVHPYLRRRKEKALATKEQEEGRYPSPELRRVLKKTLGVPLFQEQAMQIAILAAGFSPAEADRLRRSMAAFRRTGAIHAFREKFINGMVANGYDRSFAEQCFRQIEGFSEYGFPESHAASFAILVYVSAWLKYHHPAIFACALLNSQPMGFYAAAQIVRDAQEHGITALPVDINHSHWDCTLEPAEAGGEPALRLGFRQVKGLSQNDAEAVVRARRSGNGRPFFDAEDLWRRAGLPDRALEALARADAFGSTGLKRRQALWAVRRLGPPPMPLFADGGAPGAEPSVNLPEMNPGEEMSHDYAMLRLSLKTHPLTLLRGELRREGTIAAKDLDKRSAGDIVTVAGLAITRQRPGTASGVIFITLEDETGIANLIVWPSMFERYRRETLGARLLRVTGELQREGIVIHIVVRRMEDLTDRLMALADPSRPHHGHILYPSRDFH